MKILFVNLSATVFTVKTPETEPLGGTESCIAYLSRQLARNGHQVTLVSRLPPDTPQMVLGVHHAPPESLKKSDFYIRNNFDVIVACNAPSLCPIIRAISPQSRIILWDHVPPEQPSIKDLGQPEVLNAIDAIAYVSEWQRQETQNYFKFEKASFVIGNGLTPAFENMFSSHTQIMDIKQNRAAYTTIPYRGLSVLLKVMLDLPADTDLDLYSSMRVYQMNDGEHDALFREASFNPHIHSHGSVSQKQLADNLKRVAFLTYPCICAETFCIGATEALAAGMKVISTYTGALPTTTMGYADLIEITSTDANDLVKSFRESFLANIKKFLGDPVIWCEERFDQVQAVNRECTWSVRTSMWEEHLHRTAL